LVLSFSHSITRTAYAAAGQNISFRREKAARLPPKLAKFEKIWILSKKYQKTLAYK
jgi:hypothetical protein